MQVIIILVLQFSIKWIISPSVSDRHIYKSDAFFMIKNFSQIFLHMQSLIWFNNRSLQWSDFRLQHQFSMWVNRLDVMFTSIIKMRPYLNIKVMKCVFVWWRSCIISSRPIIDWKKEMKKKCKNYSRWKPTYKYLKAYFKGKYVWTSMLIYQQYDFGGR